MENTNERPIEGPDAEGMNIPVGYDYEYDEAHDALAAPMSERAAKHPVVPPAANLGDGGDYGYDEAHDFGAS